MAADLADTPITVNQLLPAGATESGMIPEDLPVEARARLLPADVMAGSSRRSSAAGWPPGPRAERSRPLGRRSATDAASSAL